MHVIEATWISTGGTGLALRSSHASLASIVRRNRETEPLVGVLHWRRRMPRAVEHSPPRKQAVKVANISYPQRHLVAYGQRGRIIREPPAHSCRRGLLHLESTHTAPIGAARRRVQVRFNAGDGFCNGGINPEPPCHGVDARH